MRVGIFDSGIGGLTVLKSLIAKYPNNHYIYFGDTLNLPYGGKSLEELEALSAKASAFLMSKKVDLIVIACGTVSSNCYHYLKSKFKVPIYDILSPTLKYLEMQKFSSVHVIATEMTIKSGVFKNIPNIKEIKCPLFVPLIEEAKIDSPEMTEAIKTYFASEEPQNLVFGCTHYPFLEAKLRSYLGDINYINMGDILASSLKLDDKFYKLDFYFSALNDNIYNIIYQMFDNYEISEV